MLPVFLYLWVPPSEVPLLQNVVVIWSCAAGVTSFFYHMSNYTVCSSIDEAVAVTTFYVNAINLNVQHRWFKNPLLNPPTQHTLVPRSIPVNIPWWVIQQLNTNKTVLPQLTTREPLPNLPSMMTQFLAIVIPLLPAFMILCLFAYRWDHTGQIPVYLVLTLFPFAVFGYLQMGCYWGLAAGISGLTSFVLDRLGVASLHPMWHVFAGVSILASVLGTTAAELGGQSDWC
ncbi:hypothetical protein HK096_000206 [Nowakowskiella sp. JEL0078]|nr:hypothetical protein HK096_000206 [Nowakowskiella sp. JEL0078]